MNSRNQTVQTKINSYRAWSWFKRTFFVIFAAIFLFSCFLFLTPAGTNIRYYVAETIIMTQHRDWAWLVVGKGKLNEMLKAKALDVERRGAAPIDPNLITISKPRSTDSLIKVEDISGPRWKGKKIYVYDPTSLRVVVPSKSGEGEKITSMVARTGAIAGINGGGFDDPSGLGNGFAPIGLIISGGNILYTGYTSSIPQQVVGFTDKGLMIVGKYSIDELLEKHIKEAVTFAPRIIANGEPLIKSGNGGSGIQPRTAVGQRADGVVIFIIIDGRQAKSVGATEKEVQDLFVAEGAINAGFLDGGASSELVTQKDGLVTSPSSRFGERRLPSAFLVFDNPSTYIETRVWDGLTHIDPGGAYDHPEFLAEQERLKRQGKSNTPKPAKTPAASVSPNASQPTHSSVDGNKSSPAPEPEESATAAPVISETISPEISETILPTIAPTASPQATLPVNRPESPIPSILP